MERERSFLVIGVSATTKESFKARFYVDRQYYDYASSSRIRMLKKNGSQSIGRGRKGLSTKIHIGLSPGCLKGACLSEGQRADMKAFSKLWFSGNWEDIRDVIADKGYDFYEVRVLIRQSGKHPIIPRRQGAVCPGIQDKDKEKYLTRFNIEHFFGKVKENKRLALRFDKLDVTFFSFFALACLKVLNLLC